MYNQAVTRTIFYALRFIEMPNAFRTEQGINHRRPIGLRDGIVGTKILTHIAVDTVFSYQQSHCVFSNNIDNDIKKVLTILLWRNDQKEHETQCLSNILINKLSAGTCDWQQNLRICTDESDH